MLNRMPINLQELLASPQTVYGVSALEPILGVSRSRAYEIKDAADFPAVAKDPGGTGQMWHRSDLIEWAFAQLDRSDELRLWTDLQIFTEERINAIPFNESEVDDPTPCLAPYGDIETMTLRRYGTLATYQGEAVAYSLHVKPNELPVLVLHDPRFGLDCHSALNWIDTSVFGGDDPDVPELFILIITAAHEDYDRAAMKLLTAHDLQADAQSGIGPTRARDFIDIGAVRLLLGFQLPRVASAAGAGPGWIPNRPDTAPPGYPGVALAFLRQERWWRDHFGTTTDIDQNDWQTFLGDRDTDVATLVTHAQNIVQAAETAEFSGVWAGHDWTTPDDISDSLLSPIKPSEAVAAARRTLSWDTPNAPKEHPDRLRALHGLHAFARSVLKEHQVAIRVAALPRPLVDRLTMNGETPVLLQDNNTRAPQCLLRIETDEQPHSPVREVDVVPWAHPQPEIMQDAYGQRVLLLPYLEDPVREEGNDSPAPIAAEIVLDAFLQSDGSRSKAHAALHVNGDIVFTRADLASRTEHTAVQTSA